MIASGKGAAAHTKMIASGLSLGIVYGRLGPAHRMHPGLIHSLR